MLEDWSECVVDPLWLRELRNREATLVPLVVFEPLAEDMLFFKLLSPPLAGGPWPFGGPSSVRITVYLASNQPFSVLRRCLFH